MSLHRVPCEAFTSVHAYDDQSVIMMYRVGRPSIAIHRHRSMVDEAGNEADWFDGVKYHQNSKAYKGQSSTVCHLPRAMIDQLVMWLHMEGHL